MLPLIHYFQKNMLRSNAWILLMFFLSLFFSMSCCVWQWHWTTKGMCVFGEKKNKKIFYLFIHLFTYSFLFTNLGRPFNVSHGTQVAMFSEKNVCPEWNLNCSFSDTQPGSWNFHRGKLKGVLHPRLVFGLFLHFSQKLQHIGNK